MVEANLTMENRYVLFREAIQTTTLLDSLIVVEIDGVKATRYKHFLEKILVGQVICGHSVRPGQ